MSGFACRRNGTPTPLCLVARPILTVLLMGLLAASPSLPARTQSTTHRLTITDGGGELIENATEFAVYEADGSGSPPVSTPIAREASPSDPVRFELPQGTYRISMSFEGRHVTTRPFELAEDEQLMVLTKQAK